MFNLNQLKHFRLVAEAGNFAAAAREANITQPALSNSIRILEERMGVQLFDRGSRPVRLTSGGRDVLTRIETLLTEAKNLEKEIAYLSQGLVGELRIGMTSQSSASIGGTILGKWLAENNQISVDVAVADTLVLLDALIAEKMDLIIGDGRDLPMSSSQFDFLPIPKQKGGAYCRAGHPLLDSPKTTFQDLLPYRFAGSHFPMSLLDNLSDLFGLGSRRCIQFAIQSDNIAVLRDATMHSDLILLTTPGSVRNVLAAGLLVELPIDLQTLASWHCVTLKDSVLHPAIPSLRSAIAMSL